MEASTKEEEVVQRIVCKSESARQPRTGAFRGGAEEREAPVRGAPLVFADRVFVIGIDNKLQTLTDGPASPRYRDIAIERGVTAHRPHLGADARPSTAWRTAVMVCAKCWAPPSATSCATWPTMRARSRKSTCTPIASAVALSPEVDSRRTLAPGGAFVAKVLAGGTDTQLLAQLKRHFTSVKHAKPPASRKDSSEWYVIAQGFKG